jgi:hypothetical protein
MKMTQSVFVFLAFLCFSCASTKNNTPAQASLAAKDLVPFGRTEFVDGKLELISSAAHFAFAFEGEECEVFASLPQWMDHNYLQYELDGVYQKRIKVERNSPQPIRISTSGNGRHTIRIYKATEATTGPVFIEKINAPNIQPVANPKAPLIEFIGNSITCGAAADASEVPCGAGVYHDQHNAYYAYGPRVARMLGANFLMSCVSGIGIYRTWNKEEPSMPQVYEKADFGVGSSRNWNFSRYTPDVVTIALGTNDLSNGDGKSPRPHFDSAKFVKAYTGFVQLVKSKYPNAQIVLLNSPMVTGDRNLLLTNCLQAIKQNVDSLNSSANPVKLFFFQPMKARGCTGHPSVEDHAILADELYPFLKNILK